MTGQNHHQVTIQIRLTTVTTDASAVKRRTIGKRIQIKDHQVQNV